MANIRVVDHTIKDGDSGIRETVRHMARLISRDASNARIASKAKSLKGKTDAETAKNIFEYVYKNYPYKSDPDDKESVAAPIRLYECAEGDDCQLPDWAGQDCDDLTVICCALYKAAGLTPLIKIIDWKPGQDGFSHVYPLVLIGEEKVFIPTDPVAKARGFGWEKSPVKRWEVFNLSGTKVASGTGKSSKTSKAVDGLAETKTHEEASGVKKWWQYVEEHAALISATTAAVSVAWVIYLHYRGQD